MKVILKSSLIALYLFVTSGCGYMDNNAAIRYQNGVFKTSETAQYQIINIEILAKQEIHPLFEWRCKRNFKDCNAVSIRAVLDSLEARHDTLIVKLRTGLLKESEHDLKTLHRFRFRSIKNQKKDSLIVLKPDRY
jgi:hypothetical protein